MNLAINLFDVFGIKNFPESFTESAKTLEEEIYRRFRQQINKNVHILGKKSWKNDIDFIFSTGKIRDTLTLLPHGRLESSLEEMLQTIDEDEEEAPRQLSRIVSQGVNRVFREAFLDRLSPSQKKKAQKYVNQLIFQECVRWFDPRRLAVIKLFKALQELARIFPTSFEESQKQLAVLSSTAKKNAAKENQELAEAHQEFFEALVKASSQCKIINPLPSGYPLRSERGKKFLDEWKTLFRNFALQGFSEGNIGQQELHDLEIYLQLYVEKFSIPQEQEEEPADVSHPHKNKKNLYYLLIGSQLLQQLGIADLLSKVVSSSPESRSSSSIFQDIAYFSQNLFSPPKFADSADLNGPPPSKADSRESGGVSQRVRRLFTGFDLFALPEASARLNSSSSFGRLTAERFEKSKEAFACSAMSAILRSHESCSSKVVWEKYANFFLAHIQDRLDDPDTPPDEKEQISYHGLEVEICNNLSNYGDLIETSRIKGKLVYETSTSMDAIAREYHYYETPFREGATAIFKQVLLDAMVLVEQGASVHLGLLRTKNAKKFHFILGVQRSAEGMSVPDFLESGLLSNQETRKRWLAAVENPIAIKNFLKRHEIILQCPLQLKDFFYDVQTGRLLLQPSDALIFGNKEQSEAVSILLDWKESDTSLSGLKNITDISQELAREWIQLSSELDANRLEQFIIQPLSTQLFPNKTKISPRDAYLLKKSAWVILNALSAADFEKIFSSNEVFTLDLPKFEIIENNLAIRLYSSSGEEPIFLTRNFSALEGSQDFRSEISKYPLTLGCKSIQRSSEVQMETLWWSWVEKKWISSPSEYKLAPTLRFLKNWACPSHYKPPASSGLKLTSFGGYPFLGKAQETQKRSSLGPFYILNYFNRQLQLEMEQTRKGNWLLAHAAELNISDELLFYLHSKGVHPATIESHQLSAPDEFGRYVSSEDIYFIKLRGNFYQIERRRDREKYLRSIQFSLYPAEKFAVRKEEMNDYLVPIENFSKSDLSTGSTRSKRERHAKNLEMGQFSKSHALPIDPNGEIVPAPTMDIRDGEALPEADLSVLKKPLFECFEERNNNTGFLAALQQIGAACKAPISTMTEETRVLLTWLRGESCPDDEELKGSRETTAESDEVLKTFTSILPGGQPLRLSQYVICPILEQQAKGWRGEKIDALEVTNAQLNGVTEILGGAKERLIGPTSSTFKKSFENSLSTSDQAFLRNQHPTKLRYNPISVPETFEENQKIFIKISQGEEVQKLELLEDGFHVQAGPREKAVYWNKLRREWRFIEDHEYTLSMAAAKEFGVHPLSPPFPDDFVDGRAISTEVVRANQKAMTVSLIEFYGELVPFFEEKFEDEGYFKSSYIYSLEDPSKTSKVEFYNGHWRLLKTNEISFEDPEKALAGLEEMGPSEDYLYFRSKIDGLYIKNGTPTHYIHTKNGKFKVSIVSEHPLILSSGKNPTKLFKISKGRNLTGKLIEGKDWLWRYGAGVDPDDLTLKSSRLISKEDLDLEPTADAGIYVDKLSGKSYISLEEKALEVHVVARDPVMVGFHHASGTFFEVVQESGLKLRRFKGLSASPEIDTFFSENPTLQKYAKRHIHPQAEFSRKLLLFFTPNGKNFLKIDENFYEIVWFKNAHLFKFKYSDGPFFEIKIENSRPTIKKYAPSELTLTQETAQFLEDKSLVKSTLGEKNIGYLKDEKLYFINKVGKDGIVHPNFFISAKGNFYAVHLAKKSEGGYFHYKLKSKDKKLSKIFTIVENQEGDLYLKFDEKSGIPFHENQFEYKDQALEISRPSSERENSELERLSYWKITAQENKIDKVEFQGLAEFVPYERYFNSDNILRAEQDVSFYRINDAQKNSVFIKRFHHPIGPKMVDGSRLIHTSSLKKANANVLAFNRLYARKFAGARILFMEDPINTENIHVACQLPLSSKSLNEWIEVGELAVLQKIKEKITSENIQQLSIQLAHKGIFPYSLDLGNAVFDMAFDQLFLTDFDDALVIPSGQTSVNENFSKKALKVAAKKIRKKINKRLEINADQDLNADPLKERTEEKNINKFRELRDTEELFDLFQSCAIDRKRRSPGLMGCFASFSSTNKREESEESYEVTAIRGRPHREPLICGKILCGGLAGDIYKLTQAENDQLPPQDRGKFVLKKYRNLVPIKHVKINPEGARVRFTDKNDQTLQMVSRTLRDMHLLYGQKSASVHLERADRENFYIFVKMFKFPGKTLLKFKKDLQARKISIAEFEKLSLYTRSGDLQRDVEGWINKLTKNGIIYKDDNPGNIIINLDKREGESGIYLVDHDSNYDAKAEVQPDEKNISGGETIPDQQPGKSRANKAQKNVGTLSQQRKRIQTIFTTFEKLIEPISEGQQHLRDQNKEILLDRLEKSKIKPVKLDKSACYIPNHQGVIKGMPDTTLEGFQFLEIGNDNYWEIDSINGNNEIIFKNQEEPLSFAKLELKNGIIQAVVPMEPSGDVRNPV